MNAEAPAGFAESIAWLSQGASTIAPHTDLLLLVMTLLCGIVALGVCIAMVAFCIRYRQGARVERSALRRRLDVELAWILIPLALFILVFVWAAHQFVAMYRVPEDALPVYVLAKQWMWKVQHRDGRREINELHVPVGTPVRLVMTSQDAIHSFYVPDFRLKQDVVPGRYTGLWFQATRPGVYPLYCAEYCGSEHSRMLGRIVVMEPGAYAHWAAQDLAQPSLAQYGYVRFRQLGCSGCHAAGSSVHAPSLDGLLGRTVHLQDGRSLVADENYVRDSILVPKKDLVAGFEPVMPSFAGQVSEEDLQALVAYLRSTGAPRSGVTP